MGTSKGIDTKDMAKAKINLTCILTYDAENPGVNIKTVPMRKNIIR
jgi:hypothetical protein